MKIIRIIVISMLFIIPSVSHAEASESECGDSFTMAYNRSMWFTGMIYSTLSCDTHMLDWYENAAAIMGSAPLNNYYTREDEVCYFEGYYTGLVERVAYEYQICTPRMEDEINRFSCIPLETLANYAAYVLVGANETIEELSEADLESIFSATPDYEVCEEVLPDESCTEKVTEVLTDNMNSDDEDLMKIFITEFCPAGGDDDEPDGGV
jgi:hypothetical protein